MKWIIDVLLTGACICLAVWCNINLQIINSNTQRIQVLESYLPVVNQVDTIYVINYQETKKKK